MELCGSEEVSSSANITDVSLDQSISWKFKKFPALTDCWVAGQVFLSQSQLQTWPSVNSQVRNTPISCRHFSLSTSTCSMFSSESQWPAFGGLGLNAGALPPGSGVTAAAASHAASHRAAAEYCCRTLPLPPAGNRTWTQPTSYKWTGPGKVTWLSVTTLLIPIRDNLELWWMPDVIID